MTEEHDIVCLSHSFDFGKEPTEEACHVSRSLGYGGVAIIWREENNPYIRTLKEGDNRIICVEIKSNDSSKPILLINSYLPTQGKSSSLAHLDEYLDVIESLFENFQDTHNIIWTGDMNSSLIRNKPQDKKLQEFVLKDKIYTNTDSNNVKPTFCHSSMNATSQIDYMFSSHDIISDFTIHDFTDFNTSDHTHISGHITLEKCFIPKKNQQSRPIKFKWKECNTQMYLDKLDSLMPSTITEPSPRVEIEALTKHSGKALSKAAKSTVKTAETFKGPIKPIPADTLEVIQNKKKAHKKWKDAGRPGEEH